MNGTNYGTKICDGEVETTKTGISLDKVNVTTFVNFRSIQRAPSHTPTLVCHNAPVLHTDRERKLGNDLTRTTREPPCGAREVLMHIFYSDSLSRCSHVSGSKIVVNQPHTTSGQASSPLGVVLPHGYPILYNLLGPLGSKICVG
jgi:hypothetical protein